MTPAHDLGTIYSRALSRVRRLDHIFVVWQGASGRDRTLIVGGLVIELDNIFIQAMRLYVQCVVRKALRRQPACIPGFTGTMTESDFTNLVISVFNSGKIATAKKKRQVLSRKDEKTIRDPGEWLFFMRKIGVPTPPDIQNALNLNYKFYEEMGLFRNFYAHRSKETIDKIILKFPQLAFGQAKHPDEIITSTPIGISQAKYIQWSSEGRTFLQVAAGQP